VSGASARLAAALAVGAGLIAVALLTLPGDGRSTRELRSLRADPLATYVPPGGRVVRTEADEQRSGGFLRKATPATLRRTIEVAPGGGDAALQAATQAAQEAGWTMGRPVPGLGVSGHRRLPTGDGTLTLSLVDDAASAPTGVQAPALGIALEHSR